MQFKAQRNITLQHDVDKITFSDFFSFGTTAPIWALAYLHETLRFTSVFKILDIR
jgi:hypothetical protein